MSDAFAKNKKRKNGVTDFFNFFFFFDRPNRTNKKLTKSQGRKATRDLVATLLIISNWLALLFVNSTNK